MRIAIIGAGTVGTALAVRWRAAGHDIAIGSHGATTEQHRAEFFADVPLESAAQAAAGADVVVLGVHDGAIAEACGDLVASGGIAAGTTVAHLSGGVRLAALESARAAGANPLCLHPLQTFPDVASALDRLPGSSMAVTATDAATASLGDRLAEDAGCRPFRLSDEDKPLYHAAAVFASNYLIAVVGQAADLMRAAGVDEPVERLLPLARASLENAAAMGADAALTGPVVRGDAATLAENLGALADRAPGSVAAYVTLADLALERATRSGRLDEAGRRAVDEVLDRWR